MVCNPVRLALPLLSPSPSRQVLAMVLLVQEVAHSAPATDPLVLVTDPLALAVVPREVGKAVVLKATAHLTAVPVPSSPSLREELELLNLPALS